MMESTEATQTFAAQRAELLARLPAHPSGVEWCSAHTKLVDTLLQEVFEEVRREFPSALEVALLAVGGYGRSEMAPYSDVDLLVVPNDEADPVLDDVLRRLHRDLHAALAKSGGVALSYAFFLVNDAPALDPKTRTALLDARRVAGSETAFDSFLAAFRETLPAGEFLLEKIAERDDAQCKWNDTPLAVEPHLKEGAGGLRSHHCANWIRKVVGAELRPLTSEVEEILKVRNLLHLVTGKNADVLTRGRQAEIAEILGTPLRDFFSQTATSLESIFLQETEARELVRSFEFGLTECARASQGRIELASDATLSGAAHAIAVGVRLGLRPGGRMNVESGEVRGPEALAAMGTGEQTLRELDRAGLLDRLLPELGRCRTLMPEDSVHAFSVFEHSLRTVRNIDAFASDTFYGRLRDGLSSPSTLYLAALLHDVGKAVPGHPHSEAGASIAEAIVGRWGLAAGVSSTIVWLVREHLTMARFVGMRDIANPKTADEFAKIVGDKERLDMLSVLTCADVNAVAPGAWTPAQDAFLRELHGRTAAVLESEVAPSDDPLLHRRRLLKTLRDHPTPDSEIESFLERLPAQYAVGTPAEMVPLHMRWVREAEAGKPTVGWDHDRERRLSELTVCTADAPGLLSRILGVLYAFDLSVHGLRASTTRGALPVALDTVLVSFGSQAAPPATCAMAAKVLKEVLSSATHLSDVLRAHGKDPDRTQDNFTYNFVGGVPGILEVQAPRGRGMAFRISKMIAAAGWNIVSARFGQWAGRGAAAFYVNGRQDQPLGKEEVDRVLRSSR